MNSSGSRESDTAGRYIVPDKIEKAPDGFTERVMMQISMENVPVRSFRRSGNEFIIPAVALVMALALIIIAGLTTSADSQFLNYVSNLLAVVNSWLPAMKGGSLQGITIPGIFFYTSTSIFILIFFDLALNRLFHYRERK